MPATAPAEPTPRRTNQIDDVDRRLIELLVEDGRASTGSLAAEVELSADAVRDRVRRLIDDGVVVIQGAINPGTVGLRMSALVGMKVRGPVDPIAQQIAELELVDFVACTAGSFDLLVELVAADRDEVYRILEEHLRPIDRVDTMEVFLYLSVEKWSSNSVPHSPISGREIDADDRQIIQALRTDGRLSYRSLAAQTGINYPTARRKAIALIDAGIIRITTTVNRIATGERVSAAIGVTVDGPIETVLGGLARIDEVLVVTVCAGRFDLFLDVETTSEDAMRTLVFDTIRGLPGVASTETFHYLRITKVPFSWMLPSGS
jgi:DNA-binding Lrp family transcriptional regulator